MADGNNLVPCVIVFKAAKDKVTQNTLVYQVAQVTTKCVDDDLKIVDSIVTHQWKTLCSTSDSISVKGCMSISSSP